MTEAQHEMELHLKINETTKKKKWHRGEECSKCPHRFPCWSGNEIFVPADLTEGLDGYFNAVFVVPRCVRIGLLKQLCSGHRGSYYKYARILGDGYINIHVVVVKLPCTLRISGYIR